MPFLRPVLLLFFAALLSFPAWAEEPESPPTPVELDPILVTGTTLKDDVDQPNMTVIVPEALLQGIGSTLDSALKRQPGIDVQRPQEVGAAMDDQSIRIRGFGASRIIVSVDGRPLNTPGTAGGYFVDWTQIPLSNVENIEVVYGVSDPRWGNTLGGVINLVTKKPTLRPVLEVQASAASFNSNNVDFYHGWKPGAFEYSISGSYAESNGYLWNGDYWLKNVNLHLGYSFPWGGRLTGDGQYVDLKKGFIVNNRLNNNFDSPFYDVSRNSRYPATDGEYMYGGMGAYAEPGSWWKRERFNYSIAYDQTVGEKGMASVRWWQNHADREAWNTRYAMKRVFHKEFYDDRSYGFDGSYRHQVPYNTITFGFDYKMLQDDGDKNLSGDYRKPFSNGSYVHSGITGIFLMDDIALMDGKLIITPGLRYTAFDGNPGPAGRAEGIPAFSANGLAPSLKVTYNMPGRSLFYISVARALRMPTPPEYYWHYSPDAGVYTGSLPFSEEDGIMVQGGWKGIFPTGTKVEFSPYYYDIKNYIAFDLINFVSYNIDRARIYGFELAVDQKLGTYFTLFANYSLQRSSTKGDPFVANFVAPVDRGFDEIPGLPEQKFNAGLQYKGSRNEKVALYVSGVSSQQVIYNNNRLYDTNLRVRTQRAYVTADIEASYPVIKHLELTGFVRNIFDADYQERFGYPAAGTNFGLGAKVSF